MAIRADSLDDLPPIGGAYALVVALSTRIPSPVPGGGPRSIEPGRYLYAGSARGPGGIRARVLRHARSGKALHWHIDRLTQSGDLQAALALPGGNECAVVARFLRTTAITVPVPGFGSSDCSTCPAHLLRVPSRLDLTNLLKLDPQAFVWINQSTSTPTGRRRAPLTA